MSPDPWPSLPLAEWQGTYDTLHMWTQIAGKIRLALSPRINHWWESALYVTPRGLTTSIISQPRQSFAILFDFLDHLLLIQSSSGKTRKLGLEPQSVAQFYRSVLDLLKDMGIEVKLNAMPQEFPNPIPFDQDETHAAYDKEYAERHWRILLQAQRLMSQFRSGFIGKCSPVHFFWGSFDLTVTRFSGRLAPPRPGADFVTREAYSHEVSSCGFWPGSGNIEGPAFYAYFAPEPEGYRDNPRIPKPAFYNLPTQGYVLSYDEVRRAPEADRDRMVLDFFQSTYQTGADLAKWDRANLERHPK